MAARESYRFLLRMPPELRGPLSAAAENSGRSLNAEIVARLEASVGAASTPLRVRRPPLVPTIAVTGVLAVAAVGGLAVAQGGSEPDSAAKAAPAGKRALLGDPPGSALPRP